MKIIVPEGTDMQDEVVGLAGDWHGSTDWAQRALTGLASVGVRHVYHLGDFGVWPGRGGEVFLRRVEQTLKRLDMRIWVTPGNHEDYDQIARVPVSSDGLQWISPRIALIPRGSAWTHNGRSFASMGGAPSIDFEQRTQGVSWWRDEVVGYQEAEDLTLLGSVHVLLTHDAPDDGTTAVQKIIDTPADKNPWSAAGLAYAAEGRQMMNMIRGGTDPLVWAHGHYHAPDDSGPTEDGCRFLSLGCDGQPMNTAVLRLSDLAVSWDGRVFS